MARARRRPILAQRYTLAQDWSRGLAAGRWTATDTVTGKDVLVVDLAGDGPDPAMADGVRAAAGIRHPSVLPVLEVVAHAGRVVAIQATVEGPTLAEAVARTGPLDASAATALARELADALAAIHAGGTSHGALTPGSVWLEEGHARLGRAGGAERAGAFTAPEVAAGDAPGPAADVWSLGAVLRFALAGTADPGQGTGPPVTTLASVADELMADDPHRRPRAGEVATMLDKADRAVTVATERPSRDEALGSVFATAAAPTEVRPPASDGGTGDGAGIAPAPGGGPVTGADGAHETAEGEADDGHYRALPSWPPPRRRLGIVSVALCSVVIAILLALLVTNGDLGRGSPNRRTTTPTTLVAAPPVIPEGWEVFRHPEVGYTIAYPPSWTATEDGTVTEFRDPEGETFLRADHRSPPGDPPLQTWLDLEGGFSSQFPSYVRLQITPTKVAGRDAAIWEFRYTNADGQTLHGVDLGVATDGYAYALYFQTPEERWDTQLDTFYRFARSFAPA